MTYRAIFIIAPGSALVGAVVTTFIFSVGPNDSTHSAHNQHVGSIAGTHATDAKFDSIRVSHLSLAS